MDWKSSFVCVILNPSAGGSRRRSKQQALWIETLTRETGKLEVVVPQNPSDVERLVSQAIEKGCDAVLAGGGDGTLHQVAQSFAQSPSESLPLIGQLPFGSGNDFLRQFDFHRLTMKNLERFMNAAPMDIDLGRCNGRWFINGVGFGLAADVGASFKTSGHSGPLGYIAASIRCAFANEPFGCTVVTDSASFETRASLMAVGNGPFSGGGFRLTPDSRPGDAHMELCVVDDISPFKLLSCLPSAIEGTHVRRPFVHTVSFRRLTLRSDRPFIGQLDGEILPASDQWEIIVHPRKIRFIAPAGA